MPRKKHLKLFWCLVSVIASCVLLYPGALVQANAAHRDLLGKPRFASQEREVQASHAFCAGCYHDERVVERWSIKHFPESYAGMYLVGARLMVGYNSRQAERVRAVKRLRRLIAPRRISSFPYVPKHSLRNLNSLEKQIVDEVMTNDAYDGLIVGVGVEIRRNRVVVGTEQVRKTRGILEGLYSPAEPIIVQYEQPPVPLVVFP